MKKKVEKSKDEWKESLTPEEFHILREKGTEPPFTGKFVDNKKKGIYKCAACGNELFSSDTKFDSGSGWPSFWDLVSKDGMDISFGVYVYHVDAPGIGEKIGRFAIIK